MKVLNKILTVVMIIALVFLVLTFSIGLPIYCRFFYFMQVEPLNIKEESGLTGEQITLAFNEIMDYLTRGKPFGVGDLAWSEGGKSHFADVKVLFNLNLAVFLASFAVVATLIVLHKTKVVSLGKRGLPSCFLTAGTVLSAVMVLLSILFLINPREAFLIFHVVFFPGKDNWMFSSYKDKIVDILPMQFFMNAGILIAASAACISVAFIIAGAKLRAPKLPRSAPQ